MRGIIFTTHWYRSRHKSFAMGIRDRKMKGLTTGFFARGKDCREVSFKVLYVALYYYALCCFTGVRSLHGTFCSEFVRPLYQTPANVPKLEFGTRKVPLLYNLYRTCTDDTNRLPWTIRDRKMKGLTTGFFAREKWLSWQEFGNGTKSI